MANRSTNTSRSQGGPDQPKPLPLWAEPIPVPDVLEDDSEASWALWREANGERRDWDSDTEPMGLS